MLYRKMFRDLKGNLTQFISIFLMMFMGILIFTGMNAVGQGMDQSSKKFYKNTNLSSAYLVGASFTKEEVAQLENVEGINMVERRLQINASLKNESKTIIQINLVESNLISSNYLIEGEPFDPNGKGIWLNSAHAEANGIKVGESLSLIVQGKEYNETVRGLIMNPEYVYALKDDNEMIPDHNNYGYAYIGLDVLNGSEEIPYNQLLIETKLSKNRLEEIKNNIFQDKHVVLAMQEDHPSVRMFQNEVDQMMAMQAIFPFVFLLIAILTTLSTMTRITVNQRMQIGSLKALGFSNGKILRHYMSYGVVTGLLGGVLGLIIGPKLLPELIFQFQKGFYTLPEWKGEIEFYVFIIVIGCIVFCGFSGYIACKKELRGVTAQILRPKAPKNSKHTKLEKSKWWINLSFDVQWNIRDLLRSKLRSAITVFGIVGCMMLITCALGLKDTVQGITHIAYKELNTYSTKVNLSNLITNDTLSSLRENEDRQFLQETVVEVIFDEIMETSMLTIVGPGDHIKYKDLTNRFVILPQSGIVVTNKFAELHKLKKGDSLRWRLYGTKDWLSSEIVEVIRNPIGQGIYISEEAYKEMNKLMKPTAFVTNDIDTTIFGEDVTSIQSIDDVVETMDTMMETMNVMIVVLVMAAVILGVVVLYNLGVLSFHERTRELTTLKVLGFQYNKLRKLLQMQNIWLSLLGTLLGLPGGYILLSYMLRFMGESFDLEPKVTILSYAVSVFGTLLMSIVVSWFLSRKLKSIDMVSALKSVE